LAGIDAEEVERAVARPARELRAAEPAFWKFLAAVGHVLAAEDAEAEHLARREIGLELRIEIAADRRGEHVAVASLRLVVDCDGAVAHEIQPAGFPRLRGDQPTLRFFLLAQRLQQRTPLVRGGPAPLSPTQAPPPCAAPASSRRRGGPRARASARPDDARP